MYSSSVPGVEDRDGGIETRFPPSDHVSGERKLEGRFHILLGNQRARLGQNRKSSRARISTVT